MTHWADVLSDALGMTFLCELRVPECEHAIVVGMYAEDPRAALGYLDGAHKVTVIWCGYDAELVPGELMGPLWDKRFRHLATHERIRRLLHAKGIESSVVNLPTTHHFSVTGLPKEKRVAFYGDESYGLEMARRVVPSGDLITYRFGDVTNAGLAEIVSRSRVYLRLHTQDSNAATPREFMEAGRRVVSTIDQPFVFRVRADDEEGIRKALDSALAASEPDMAAAAHYKADNAPERFVRDFRKLAWSFPGVVPP